jgi:hypothetical protein
MSIRPIYVLDFNTYIKEICIHIGAFLYINIYMYICMYIYIYILSYYLQEASLSMSIMLVISRHQMKRRPSTIINTSFF